MLFKPHPVNQSFGITASLYGVLNLVSVPKVGSNSSVKIVKPWADFRNKTSIGGMEAGFLSITFHPKYSQNGKVYFAYTSRKDTSPGVPVKA